MYVYRPVQQLTRKDFWARLNDSRGRWNGAWCLEDYWNVVRFSSEKIGGLFTIDMKDFSEWIDLHSLIELQMSGGTFT